MIDQQVLSSKILNTKDVTDITLKIVAMSALCNSLHAQSLQLRLFKVQLEASVYAEQIHNSFIIFFNGYRITLEIIYFLDERHDDTEILKNKNCSLILTTLHYQCNKSYEYY